MAGDQVIRIVIIEDNKVFREALELLLGLRSDLVVVASVPDGEEVVPTCSRVQPGCRADGLPAARARRHRGDARAEAGVPGVAVVALTASANRDEMQALREAGAVACLTKDQELEVIIDAIHQAAAA